MFWQRYPLLRLALAFCLGILWANFFEVNHQIVFILTTISVLLWLVLAWGKSFNQTLGRSFYGVSTALLFTLLGATCSVLYLDVAHQRDVEAFTQQGVYQVELIQQPVQRKTTWRSEAYVKRLDTISIRAKALIYLETDTTGKCVPHYGDQFVIKSRFRLLEPPKNPYEFDYKNYLNLRGVRLNGYVSLEQQTLTETDSNSFMARVIGWRVSLLEAIEDWGLPKDQMEVSKALLLGYRQTLDPELMQAYSAVGAMHVLAVSGLHVGIVFLVLSRVLFFLRSKRQQLLKTLLLVLALWAYACISGLSPSVVRASTMFTFVAIGTGFNRNTAIYNTLLASFLFLLFIKPTYLFEVGFQLSYLAVFGIVWLQPKFQKLLKPRAWLLKQIWSITTVSLAAQIATFPLGLYYFHQFPGLFLVSNLVVIPLVTLLMYLGLFLLIQSLFMAPISILLKCYSFLLSSMNSAVQSIEQWKSMLIDQIHISRLELVLFYTFLAFFFHALFKRSAQALYVSLCLFISIQLYQLYENHVLYSKPELTIYSIKGETAVSFRTADQLYFISSQNLRQDTAKLTFHVWHHWWATNVERSVYLDLKDTYVDSNVLKNASNWLFHQKRICYNPQNDVDGHVWLIDRSWPDEVEGVPLETLVLSGVLKPSQRKAWRIWAKQHDIKCIDLLEQGAWRLI